MRPFSLDNRVYLVSIGLNDGFDDIPLYSFRYVVKEYWLSDIRILLIMFGFFDFNVTEIVEFPVVLFSLQLISNLLAGSVLYMRYAFSTLSEHLYAFVSAAI